VRDGPADLLALAAELLRACRVQQRPPQEVLAARNLSQLPPAGRRAVALGVYGAIASRRRLAFGLGEAFADLPADRQDLALVLAHCVMRGTMDSGRAARVFTARGGRLSFAGVAPAAFAKAVAAIADPVTRFGVRHSLPDWLATALRAEFGGEADAVAGALLEPPPRTVRANTLRVADRAALAAALRASGVACSPTTFAPDGLQIDDDTPLHDLQLFHDGCFEQQDEASQLVACVTAPPPRGRVLDACAGTGGKTLALAAMLRNRGEIRACEVDAGRLDVLARRCRRAGAGNVRPRQVPADSWPSDVLEFAARADRILLDVPCSGTGALRRRPDARWRLEPAHLAPLRAIQADVLRRAAGAVRPGARIVYATCSLLRAENEAQVETLVREAAGIELVRVAEVMGTAASSAWTTPDGRFLALRPDRHGTDGFFAAILRRRR
jgi:16S rRNA (cytosine967-C5)-methyltransferase